MIEVRITPAELNRFDNEVLKGDHVLKKLRKAGIPVIGVLWPRGASGGGLTMVTDDAGGLHFTWAGTPPEPEEEALW